jgi:hypothetical protein
MAKKYQIPFDKEGNQLHYPDNWSIHEWRDAEPFEETLIFDGYSRGRSAAYLNFHRKSNGTTINVFMTDFVDMVPLMVHGEVTACFEYTKRGQNYGVKLSND